MYFYGQLIRLARAHAYLNIETVLVIPDLHFCQDELDILKTCDLMCALYFDILLLYVGL